MDNLSLASKLRQCLQNPALEVMFRRHRYSLTALDAHTLPWRATAYFVSSNVDQATGTSAAATSPLSVADMHGQPLLVFLRRSLLTMPVPP